MDNEFRQFFTDEQIEELDLEELSRIAGGSKSAEVKCPVCGKKYPVREIKAHIQSAHGGQ